MENHNDFNLFYRSYLGINDKKIIQGITVCVSNNRDLPLNKNFYYKIIITEYNGKCVVSCSPEVEKEKINNICNLIKNRTIEDIIETKIHIETYDRACMYRMVLNEEPDYSSLSELKIGKKIVCFKYNKVMKKFLALIEETLIGYSKVSDVYYSYGNLVVWIDEEYRRNGVAEQLVKLSIEQCYKDGINPMYITKSNNTASFSLAQKLKFKIVKKEVIFSSR